MKKTVVSINLTYIYDASHSGAHYTLDGTHYMNNGDFAEVVTKAGLGYAPVKDGNTAYDIASDIEELNASVKSSRFTLTSRSLADTFEDSIEVYFQTVHSTTWIYTVILEDTATLYFMDAEEFKTFLYGFASLNERKVVRGKTTSTKMITWLESRVK